MAVCSMAPEATPPAGELHRALGNPAPVLRRTNETVAMTQPRMHDDEVDTDPELVRRLLAAQHPQWADLPIERVRSAGTDNAMYRLGDELAVRLPRIHWAVESVAKERTWLPLLAPAPAPRGAAAGGTGRTRGRVSVSVECRALAPW